jgi:hypothetical protein
MTMNSNDDRREPAIGFEVQVAVKFVSLSMDHSSVLSPKYEVFCRRVAMKMGRRLRCSSVTYRFRYAPSSASPARTALPAAHFDRNKIPRISGTGH